jgi:hypothetical protein
MLVNLRPVLQASVHQKAIIDRLLSERTVAFLLILCNYAADIRLRNFVYLRTGLDRFNHIIEIGNFGALTISGQLKLRLFYLRKLQAHSFLNTKIFWESESFQLLLFCVARLNNSFYFVRCMFPY